MTSHIVSLFDKIKNSDNPCVKRVTHFYESQILLSIEKWEPIVLKRLSNWILTSDQQVHSFNSRPVFMILVLLFQIFLFFYNIEPNSAYFLSSISRFTILSLIGIPLEVAHGTPQISIFYLISLFYTQAIGEILRDEYNILFNDSTTFSLICLHSTNIIKNWPTFPHKYIRLAVIFLISVPLEVNDVYGQLQTFHWRWSIVHQTCGLAGCLTGFLLGFFWIYRSKENETDTNIQVKYLPVVIGCMILFALITKLSQFHEFTKRLS